MLAFLKIDLTKERSKSTQMTINFIATIVSYVVMLGISFFLTPYIVSHLGMAAYGFIGFANTIVGYASIFTIAVNSMAHRFIIVKYHENNIIESSKYLASTFYANLFIACIICIVFGVIAVYFDSLFEVPNELVTDVKSLFTLLFIGWFISLCTGIYSVGYHIKNRLDLYTIASLSTEFLRGLLIFIIFGLFEPALWYFGLIGLITTSLLAMINIMYFKVLVPQLVLRLKYFNFSYVIKLVKSGIWSVFSVLGTMLSEGFNLMIINLLIGSYFMGVSNISKTLPLLLTGFFSTVATTFNPELTRLYAIKDFNALKNTLLQTIRILGTFALIPCAGILAYSDIFFYSWLPNQDYAQLYYLSSATMIALTLTLPLQSTWHIFVLTDKLKTLTVNFFIFTLVNLISSIIVVYLVPDNLYKLYGMVGVNVITMIVRTITFTAPVSAKMLGYPLSTFYVPVLKSTALIIILTFISLLFKHYFITSYSWFSLCICAGFTICTGLLIAYCFALTQEDKKIIAAKILRR